MRHIGLKTLRAASMCMGMILSASGIAADSAPPVPGQAQSAPGKGAQAQVDKQTAEKRKKLVADATAAIVDTELALKALEDKKNDEALKALASVTGKIELIVARDPKLALAPVRTDVVTYDLFASLDTIKASIREARKALGDGEILKARPLVAGLASEIQFRTTNIPLATYPEAIKAITPLIDAGKIDEAKAQLQAALNTLVITTEMVPLPKLRAENLLNEAQILAEKKDRSQDENDELARHFASAREQLQMAELLGYGKKKEYKSIYTQLAKIERESGGGKSVNGGFDKIKKQLSELF